MHFGSTREHCVGGQDFSFATIVRRNRSRLTEANGIGIARAQRLTKFARRLNPVRLSIEEAREAWPKHN